MSSQKNSNEKNVIAILQLILFVVYLGVCGLCFVQGNFLNGFLYFLSSFVFGLSSVISFKRIEQSVKEITPNLEEEIKKIKKEYGYIRAAKYVRSATGMSLVEAKNYVEGL